MTTCLQCHTLNPQGERLCLSCGSKLQDQNATAVEPAATTCPNGHPVDPSWSQCPYCTREQAAGPPGPPKVTVVEDDLTQPMSYDALRATSRTRLETDESTPPGGGASPGSRRTRLEGDPVSPASPAVPPGAPAAGGPAAGGPAAGPRRTRLEGTDSGAPPFGAPAPAAGAPAATGPRPTRLESSTPAARHTVLHDESAEIHATSPPGTFATPAAPAPSPQEARAGDTRKLVAVLGAPGLGPGGAVFPIRSGKNFIGAATSSEVCLRQDQEVSSEHALILHRGGVFYLADRMSTNGTWINGKEVDATSSATVLKDRDRIRCGKTELVFLALDPAGSGDSEVSTGED